MKGILLPCCLCLIAGPAWAQPAERPIPKAAPDVSYPFDIAIVDPDAADSLPPYMVVFGEGLDSKGKDVKGPLGRLEALRGASKMFPESNKDPGLPVVLRGLRFHRLIGASGAVLGYELELQGEYNAIKVPLSADDMKKFLAGERVVFELKGQANFGLYSYVSSVRMDVQFRGGEMKIYGIEGDFTFREGFRSYTSATKKIAPPPGRNYLYRGEPKDLPTLPIL